MRQKPGTRRTALEKIRIVLDGLRGKMSIPGLCRREDVLNPVIEHHSKKCSRFLDKMMQQNK